MAINFPTGSTVGELYTYSGKTWQWSGDFWRFYSYNVNYIISASTVGAGSSSISNVSTSTIFLKSFSGVNINISSTSNTLTFSGNPKGDLLNVTEATRTGLTPTIGYMVYQTDGSDGVYVYKASGWVQMI
jgi:hypothetical protein